MDKTIEKVIDNRRISNQEGLKLLEEGDLYQ
jgi:hypothetical protein